MSTGTEVTQQDMHDLLNIFGKNAYYAGLSENSSQDERILKKCKSLFQQDYTITELDNSDGVLNRHYPGRIFIPEHEIAYHMTSTLTPSSPSVLSQTNLAPQNITRNNDVYTTSCSSSTKDSAYNSINEFVTFANTATQQNYFMQHQRYTQHAPTQSYLQQQHHLMQQTSNTKNVPATSTSSTNTIYEDTFDIGKVRELISVGKYARCRQRFPVPVIIYRGKFICRSATTSVITESYAIHFVDRAFSYLAGTKFAGNVQKNDDNENNDSEDALSNHDDRPPFSYEEAMKSDVQILNNLNVSTIIDLMVEQRKIKFKITFSSSEKADGRDSYYADFNLLSLPYPGCEFFKKFRDNNYMAKNLFYDWEQEFNNARISMPDMCSLNEMNINWMEYKMWDLVQITQNYLRACLKCMQEEKGGILIHCISGWDRTPLFISLLRLSLWADGLIHQSLSAQQITYLTLAYDWYLFGHQLPSRLKRDEDIMFFCFHVLKYITDEEFTIVEYRKRTKTSSSGSSVIVLKSDVCDEEALKEDSMLGCDQDSNDSISNSSVCDMDNYFPKATPAAHDSCSNIAAANTLTNRSPNSKRSTTTSPISVPSASGRRQRYESTSSIGSSWNLVTATGSMESLHNISLNNLNTSNNSNLPTLRPALVLRKQRLSAVRDIFIQAYSRTVGLKFQEGSGMNLVTLLGNLADQLF